ncbi:hypothetical protein SAMN05443637_104271 [Pseudonocardia thermophila]|jgi:Dipeptidyl aminopeptidases/acylaminoacyl-peptidases|uniref:Xaa-Pro dipeptidyl-peptidase-like domain-containing protein n=1 Tax=Pseudonocardia thermophila TaxID=1848 RepID=A0A1M6RAQ3_PSETH|nr:alpha/beta fold hydrolase [Pseudonocardia thermophila]SHK29506.1 hypothetical protein SAMN05443637_104271 [Pseudonocardia thermophila]
MREDISFPADDGVTLRGWFYRPDGATGPTPTVVMAHGFSATKEMHLDDFAEVFADAGLSVLVYDNRNLGDSDKPVPGEIDPWQQINDYRAAITWASLRDDVDADRIGIWGSSYSGAHVLVVAAIDRRVKCVVSQVPLISGSENARRLIRSDHFAALRQALDADRVARYQGEKPGMIPVTWEKSPDEQCVLPTADTHDFFFGPIRERAKTWRNEVTLRSVDLFLAYEPGFYLPLISPTPLLLVVAAGDHLTPADIALKAFEQAAEPKKLLLLPGGHFDAYVGDAFKQSSPVQRDWFLTHLT